MQHKNFLSNLFLVFTIMSLTFLFSGYSAQRLSYFGQNAYNTKDYLVAVGYFKEIIAQNPNDTEAYYWLGKTYLDAGDSARSIDCLKKVVDANNSTSDKFKKNAYVALVTAYNNYKVGDHEKALESAKKANEIMPGTDLELLSSLIYIYDTTDRITDAINLQKRFNPPENALSRQYRILSYLYNRNHNYDEAVKNGIRAIDAMPENEIAYYMVGVATCQKGQYDKGLDTIRKALKMQNSLGAMGQFPMTVSLAYFLAKNGQYSESATAYNDAIKIAGSITTDYNPFLMLSALSYYNVGKYDEALFTVNKVINDSENGRIGLFFRTSNYNKNIYYIFDTVKNSPAEKAGLQYGDRVIAIDNIKAKRWTINQIVGALSGPIGSKVTLKIDRNGKFNRGADIKKETFDVTLTRENLNCKAQNKNLANAYGLRSLIYRGKGDIKNSISDAEQAYALSPESVNAKIAYAMAKIEKGYYLTAIDTFSSIRPKMIENERLYNFNEYYFFTPFASDEEQMKLVKSIAYAKLGKIDKVIEIMPDNEQIAQLPCLAGDYDKLSKVLEQISKFHEEKAVSFQHNGDLNSALDEYTTAVALNTDENKNKTIKNDILNLVKQMPALPAMPEEARTHMVRAEALLGENDFQACLKEYKSAMRLAPYIPKLYYNTAIVYGNLKNYTDAISYMKNYISLAPEASNVQDAKDEITKWELMLERQ